MNGVRGDEMFVGPPFEQPPTVGDLERRLFEVESMLAVGQELASTLDLAQVLELALAKAEEVCRAETSSIWEVDEARGELFFRVVRGRVARQIRDLRVRLGEGIVGAVAASGHPEVVHDVVSDPRWKGDPTSAFRTRAILAVPLAARGRTIGVLQLLNPVDGPTFSADDLRRLKLFAAVLSPALDNARLYEGQRRQFVDTVTAIAEAVEKRDPYTGGHVRRVVAYSLLLGRELGLDARDLQELRLAATLHDVGKIATPDAVLQKPAPLDAGEAEVMRRHATDGAEIVARIRDLRFVLPGVRHHHERFDGLGYPDSLAGEEIALAARIIAVADTYDAMTTHRPYRQGLEAERAALEIRNGAGTQFCPRVAGAFTALYERGEFELEEGLALWASQSGEFDLLSET